jgi:hypothetical protein
MRGSSLIFLFGMLVFGNPAANAQYSEREWPEAPSKQRSSRPVAAATTSIEYLAKRNNPTGDALL